MYKHSKMGIFWLKFYKPKFGNKFLFMLLSALFTGFYKL